MDLIQIIDMPIVKGREIIPFEPTCQADGKMKDWPVYVSDMMACYHISHAAIFDVENHKLLATSDENFTLQDTELQDLCHGILHPQKFKDEGVRVNGVTYKCCVANGKFGVMAKSGLPAEGMSACLTKKLLLVATHGPKMKSLVCNETVMILGDFFFRKGL